MESQIEPRQHLLLFWGNYLHLDFRARMPAETINGLYKAEVIHRKGPWKSMEAVEYATLIRVDWFNKKRLFGPIGHIPPAEAEANYYAALKETAIAA